MTFDEWWNENHILRADAKTMAEFAWNHQQNEMDAQWWTWVMWSGWIFVIGMLVG